MGSGAFLVAACRFLADCCEQALIRDGQWLDGDATPASRATLRRNVAERCLYGVDLNPTAVQLARLSLWLTTLAADRPLTFLDHHLASGNSLIGARLARPVAAAAAAPIGQDAGSLPLFDDLIADEVAQHVLPARLRLALEPSDSLDAVKNKERSLARSPVRTARSRNGRRRRTRGARRGCGRIVRTFAGAGQRMDQPLRSARRPSLPAAQLARVARARAREVAAVTACFIGSWRFRKCSSTRTAGLAPDARLRRGDRQSALGHVRADTDRVARTRDRCAAQSRFAHPASGHRSSKQLPVVPRARAAARPGRAARRTDPALGHRHRSRQRGAAAAALRSDHDRYLARLRQPRAAFSRFTAACASSCLSTTNAGCDRDVALSLRPDRSRSARSR